MNEQQIRAAILAHIRKTGRQPNYSSVGGYDAANPVFTQMIAEGVLVWGTKVSPTGKNMKTLFIAADIKA